MLNDPVNAANFTTAYRADGQPASDAAPNGNTTAFAYDVLGHLTSKDTTAGATNRALYDWTYNRAGQILTEPSTISGDPSNGTRTTAYDPLGRLTGSTLAGTTTSYGWAAVPNRTSVQVGAGATATTAYDAANRPTSGANPTAAYSSDDDGALTARPGFRYEWDHLGRLVKVKPPTGGSTLATYTYDPLDRLRMADYGGSTRVHFRYVGLTTAVAQTIDDPTGTVIRHFGTGWGGERLLDWTGSGANLRVYGENAHHDVTWTAGSTGAVSATLRYDPWGTLTASTGSSLPDHRFQGSWYDATTELSWVVSRWYAPTLGRFLSEDSLLGEPQDPPSRHLYAYGQGEPVGRWDPDGRWWYFLTIKATLGAIARVTLGKSSRWPMLSFANRRRWPGGGSASSTVPANTFIYIPTQWFYRWSDRVWWSRKDDVRPPWAHPPGTGTYKTLSSQWRTWIHQGQRALDLGDPNAAFSFSRQALFRKIDEKTGYRPRRPTSWDGFWFGFKLRNYNALAWVLAGGNASEFLPGVRVAPGASPWFCDNHPCTVGQFIFLNGFGRTTQLLAHEYIHVLQWEGRGEDFGRDYLWSRLAVGDASPRHPDEAPAYLYEALYQYFGPYYERPPWRIWRRPPI